MSSLKKTAVPEYNILLLGESGAGKSLMINSIPVYLQHKTLEEALEAPDIPCLIPVSFTITNDDFENIKVTFGGDCSSENHVEGESCTLGCISYEFHCNNCVIRLIDSPGVASTQGKEQDQKNMEFVLEKINTYKEIHAIAIVLKSSQTKLTPQLKSCLDQILTHLHSSAALNLIFLLTHSESTDYKPGSIQPILRKHFEEMKERSVSKVNITLNKSNIFCVDNKGYRYLVAKSQGAISDEEPGVSYVSSYTQSANELGRLLKYVIGGYDFPGLSAHQVFNTMTINEARQFIKYIEPTLKAIIKEINKNQNHIKSNVQRKEKVIETIAMNQDFRIKKEKLDECSLVRKQWLCKSEKCRRHIVEEEDEVTFYYPRICSDASSWAWTIKKTCNICQCKASEHKKMSSETKTKVIEVIDESKQSSFSAAVLSKSRLEENINKTEVKKSKLQEEQNFIESAITIFDKFYLANAIVLTDESNLLRVESISPHDVTLQEVIETKDKLFRLESFGPHIKYTYFGSLYNRRAVNLNSNVRVGNSFPLAKRFPKLSFAK